MIGGARRNNEAIVYQILKHYLAVDAGMADEAIKRLVGLLDKEGATL